MIRPLSLNLRERVVAAMAGGAGRVPIRGVGGRRHDGGGHRDKLR